MDQASGFSYIQFLNFGHPVFEKLSYALNDCSQISICDHVSLPTPTYFPYPCSVSSIPFHPPWSWQWLDFSLETQACTSSLETFERSLLQIHFPWSLCENYWCWNGLLERLRRRILQLNRPEFDSWIHHLLTVWPLSKYLFLIVLFFKCERSKIYAKALSTQPNTWYLTDKL